MRCQCRTGRRRTVTGNRSRPRPGTGPFFGQLGPFDAKHVGRKHGPVPLSSAPAFSPACLHFDNRSAESECRSTCVGRPCRFTMTGVEVAGWTALVGSARRWIPHVSWEDTTVSKATPDNRLTGRREFLSMLSAAAASGLVGASGAVAAPSAGSSAAGGSAPNATAMPTIALGPHRISRLVVGSNPILGYSYMGKHTDQHMKEYFTTEQTVKFLQDCEQAGITAHQFSTPDRAADYIRLMQGQRARRCKFHLPALPAARRSRRRSTSPNRSPSPITAAQPIGSSPREIERVHDYVKAVKDSGVLAGVSAHNPDCITRGRRGLGSRFLHDLSFPHAQNRRQRFLHADA